MKSKNVKKIAGLIFLFSVQTFGGTLNIPLNTLTKPAFDLIDQKGNPLYTNDITRLFYQKADLSIFNPVDNKYWLDVNTDSISKDDEARMSSFIKKYKKQKNKYQLNVLNRYYSQKNQNLISLHSNQKPQLISAVDTELQKKMPANGDTINFEQELGAIRELSLYGFTASPAKNMNQRFGITLGGTVHYSLMRAALLRKLGYYQESPKHVQSLRLHFKSKDEKTNFIKQAFCGANGEIDETNVNCLSLDPYKTSEGREVISDVSGSETDIMIYDAYIENYDNETPSLIDGITPATGSLVTYNSLSRSYRALALVFAITNFRENIESIEPYACKLQAGTVSVEVPFDFQFSDLDMSDARWILRKMSQLQEQDWNEVIAAAKFPQKYADTFKNKLLLRYKSCLVAFYDEAQKFDQVYVSRENSGEMLKGIQIPQAISNVTDKYLPGYTQRFSTDEVQSPLKPGSYKSIFNLVTLNAIIGAAVDKLTTKLNEKLNLKTESQNLKAIKVDSEGPHYLVSGDGTAANIRFSVNRTLSTGNYYGSDSAVQLIDNLTIGAQLLTQKFNLNLSDFLKTFSAGVYKTRDYTHVRPVGDITKVNEIPKKDMYVKSKLKEILSPLEAGDVTKFFDTKNFSVGEVLIITDAYGGVASFSPSQVFNNLIGFYKKALSLSIDVSYSYALQSQIQLIRTPKGFQVITREYENKNRDSSIGIDQFLNLLTLTHSNSNSHIDSHVYDIAINTDLLNQDLDKPDNPDDLVGKTPEELSHIDEVKKKQKQAQDKEKAKAKAFASLIRDLFLNSNTQSKNFEPFKYDQINLTQDLLTDEVKMKLLWFRQSNFEETHTVTAYKPNIYIPPSIQAQIESGDYTLEKNEAITITGYKKGELAGKDYLGFGASLGEDYLNHKFPKFSFAFGLERSNPANMPFGRAQWHAVRTESLVAPQEKKDLFPSVARIQNIWGGWSITKPELEAAIKVIQDKFKGSRWQDIQIFPEGIWDHTQKIDFFRMTENYSLMPEAVSILENYFILPAAQTQQSVDQRGLLDRMFSKLSQLGANNKYNIQDMNTLNKIYYVMGYDGTNQNYAQKGAAKYQKICQAEKEKRYRSSQNYSGTWSRGTYYECLEDWADEIIGISREYSKSDAITRNKMLGRLIYALEKIVEPKYIFDLIGEKNYIYFVEVVGFRVGDAAEKADNGVVVSKTFGLPENKPRYVNGLMSTLSDYFGGLPGFILNQSNTSAD